MSSASSRTPARLTCPRCGAQVEHHGEGPTALLSMRDVASRTGLSISTLDNAVRDGRLAVVRIGRLRRVTEESLAAYINGRSS